jgi:hypothetical protein
MLAMVVRKVSQTRAKNGKVVPVKEECFESSKESAIGPRAKILGWFL